LKLAVKICVPCNFHLFSPTPNAISTLPTAHPFSLLNLLFNLAGSEICCRRRRCRAAAENCSDPNGIIESLVHPEVIENGELIDYLRFSFGFSLFTAITNALRALHRELKWLRAFTGAPVILAQADGFSIWSLFKR
jgi:hypothetical protein